MKIILHTIMGIKDIVGQRLTEIELPRGATIAAFLAFMQDKWGDKLSAQLFDPEHGEVLPHVRIMVNGQTINYLAGTQTVLKEGDEVLILPPVSGG